MTDSIILPPILTLQETIYEDLGFENGGYSIEINAPTDLAVGKTGTWEVIVYDENTEEVSSELYSVKWEFGDDWLYNIPPSPNEKFLFPESRDQDMCEDDVYLYTQELEPHHGKGGEIVQYIWNETGATHIPYLYPAGAIRGNEFRAYNSNANRNVLNVDNATAVTTGMYVVLENVWKITGAAGKTLASITPEFTHFTEPPAIPTKFYIYDSLEYQTTPFTGGQRNLLHSSYGRYSNGTFIDIGDGEDFPDEAADAYLVIPVAYTVISTGAGPVITLSANINLPFRGSSSKFWYNVMSGENALSGGGTMAGATLTVTGVNPFYHYNTITLSGILRGMPAVITNSENSSYYSLIDTNTDNSITFLTTGMTGTGFQYNLRFKQQPIILLNQVELYDTNLTVLSLYPMQNYLDLYDTLYLAFDSGEIVEVIDVSGGTDNIYDLTVVRQALFGDLYPIQKHYVGSFLHDIAFRGTRNASGDVEIDNSYMMWTREFRQNYVFSGYTEYDYP